MVWGLFPADPLSGEEKYYIFCKGTFKVGRKGCDVIITKDKGVSRIHAEIVVDEMTLSNHLQKRSVKSSITRIRDCSKYGTFISKNLGSKEKVHEFPNKETILEDGDLISFGTGNATYRFCFVPIVLFICHMESFQANKLLQERISSIGASFSCTWGPECTHVLADEFITLKADVIDAIVAKRPFVRSGWVEFIAEKNIGTGIPISASCIPTVMLEGVSVKVADPKSRENCLRGYTFLLVSTSQYKVGDRLQPLLESVGARVVPVEQFFPASQGIEDEGGNSVVLVIPTELKDSLECPRAMSSLPRVDEINLICTTLSGHLDNSVLTLPPVLVTSSCSTDETVVADSDVEVELSSVHDSASISKTEPVIDEVKGKVSIIKVESFGHEEKVVEAARSVDSTEHNFMRNPSIDQGEAKRKDGQVASLREVYDCITTQARKVDESESGNSDIIYSQDLVVKDTNVPASVNLQKNDTFVNFKRFRKIGVQSGNSFDNLIPFSKYPYKDSDYEDEEVVQTVKEEKKRKQMEAVAEDLFNSEKVR